MTQESQDPMVIDPEMNLPDEQPTPPDAEPLPPEEALPADEPAAPAEPLYEIAEAAPRRRKPRALFWGLGILLVVSILIVVLIKVLNIQVAWQDGKLTVSLFGADSSYVADAVTGNAAEAQPVPQIARAPIGTGVTLTLSDAPDEPLTLQALYRLASPSTVSVLATLPGGEGTGSGIVMSDDGYILTNHHVISGATAVSVQTHDGTAYDAALVGSDEFSDLAVLKINASGLTAATFAGSDGLQVGDAVVAIGDPLGIELRGTMTDGIISAINRDIVVEDRSMTLLQTNAALNAGNSGGPLLNLAGQVIGINTMKLSSSYTSIEGLGFAIPMDVAKPLIDELIASGYVSGRPALGITGTAVAAQTSAFYNIPAGIYINEVEPNSDAARQGLQPGDIITAIEETEVFTIDELNTIKNQFRAGDTVHLTIWRDGETLQIGVTLIDQAQ